MPEPTPSSPAPGTSGSPPVSASALVQTFIAVLTRPATFFESVKGQTGYKDPLVFAVVMGLVGGVIHAVLSLARLLPVAAAGAGLAMIILMPIFSVLGCFIGGAIVHVVAMIAGGKGSFEHSVRIAGYSSAVLPVSAVLSFAPILQHLPSFYGLYVAALGIIALHLADRRRTFVVTGVLAVILAIFVVMGLMAASAARRAGDELRAKYGEGSEFQKEMQKMTDDLKKAAEDARKAAEKQGK